MLSPGLISAMAANPAIEHSLEKPLTSQIAQSGSLSGSWRLVNMTLSEPTPMIPLPTTELTADFSDGRISGSGGCNRFMGSYQTQGEQLSVSPLASTFKACESPILDQETRYLMALQGAQQYEIDNQGQLIISYQTEQESGILRFAAQEVRGLW